MITPGLRTTRAIGTPALDSTMRCCRTRFNSATTSTDDA